MNANIETTEERLARVTENWNFVKANATNTATHFPKGWIEEVRAEAIEVGILRPSNRLGANCNPEIDRGVVYGGDMEDVF